MADCPRPTPIRGAARFAALLVLAGALSGCSTWHVTETAPAAVLASDDRPPKVRVTDDEGAQTVLVRPRVLANVLAGYEDQCIERFGQNSGECPEIGIPLFEIATFEVQRRGAASIYLPAVGGLLAAWLLANR